MASRPIKIAIIGDDSQLKKTLKQTSKRLEGFGRSVAKVGATAGLAFAGTATAVAGAGLKAFMGFETGMREVLTLLPGAGKEVFDELGDQVKNLSKEFGVLPDKVIPALYQSISAGIPKENVGEFLRVAAMAAKGGVTDLETAVDGITSVVNAYGSEVMSATEASDLLFTAVKLGKTDFGQLSKEVYKVGPIAAAVGIDFGAVAGALANLTAQGTPTAVAASQLKAAFSELAKEGTKSDQAFRDLAGVGMADFLANGGTLQEALLMMKDSADDLGISVLDMFSSIEAGAAVLALTADGGAALSATMAEMDASAGATTTAFETMDQGLAVTLDKIKANIAVMAIEVGEKLAPHVLAATEAIMDGFERLRPHIERAKEVVQEWATEFAERMTPHVERFVEAAKKVIDWVRDFVRENPHSVLAALAAVVGGVLVAAVIGLTLAFASLFSPLVLITLAVAALAGGVVYAYENFEGFRNVVDTVRDWMVNTLWPALKMVAENIVIAFGAVKDALVSAFDWLNEHRDFTVLLAGAVGGLVAGLIVWKTVTLAIAAAQKVAAIATAALNVVMALNPVMLVVVALVALVGMLVAAYFRFESVRNIVDSVWQKIQAWANWLWNYLGPALVAIWDGIVATFTAVLTFFQEDFIPLVQEVAETVVEIWQAIADFFTDNFLPAVIAVADAVTVAFRALADFFMVYVWPIITTAFDAINSVVQNFWDVIMSVYDLVRALFSGDFKEVWFKFRDMIGEVLQFVVDLFVMLPLKIWDAARPLIGKFALIVSDFAVFLVGKIVKLIQSIPDQIVEFISGIATDILNIGKDIGGWIIDGLVAAIKGAAGAVADAVRAIIPDVGSIASGVAGSVGGWFKGLVPGLATGGIVTSPTLALIGEAGPEAVVPLDRLHGGGGSTFNITVNAGLGTDGRQVGTQIVSALKQWERSNGSLPLSVSAV